MQSTYIYQYQPRFEVPYSGPNSLAPGPSHGYTFSATAMLASRPWTGGEFYLEPEAVSSIPISNLTGLGGLTNGENQKGGGVSPEYYVARFFLRQTWNLGGKPVEQEASLTQLPTTVDSRRVVLTVGKYAVTDIFDTSNYSGDPRNTFLNWSFLTYGAWDYAADVRGYTWGATLSCHDNDWTWRVGRFLEPAVPNGPTLDTRIMQNHGDQIEIEHDHDLAGRPGFVKLLLYRNVAAMGSYAQAVERALQAGGTPNLASTRRQRAKLGIGLHVEQQISPALGLFARVSKNDGGEEENAFTEIDEQAQAGLALNGSAWHRPDDTWGLAYAINSLSAAHRTYLAAGGLGNFLGDGKLDYRPEQVWESYYRYQVSHDWSLSADAQVIANPGYNAARSGPVGFFAVRLHYQSF